MTDKIYSTWAFTANELEKRDINYKIYQQLCEKYKIKRVRRRSISDEQALICDEGNLCYGYGIRNDKIVIYTD